MWQRILRKEWNKKNIYLQTNCQWFLWTVIFSKYVTYGLTIYIDIFLFKILCEEPLIVVTIAAVCDDVMLRSVSLNKVCHVSRNGVTRRVRRQDVATSPSRRRGDTGTGSGTRKAAGIISDWQKLLSAAHRLYHLITVHSPTGRSRSSKENLGAAGHVVVTLFFEWSAQSVWLCVILISYINLIVR